MFVRVVRFTGATEDTVNAVITRIKESGGPPPGVDASGLKLLFDASGGTAIVLQEFPTEQAMQDAAKIFDAMQPSETPGDRASVDACEVRHVEVV
ncbi:MAG TPA: hypothetical protein VMI13_07815 [Solirubrobacteraceae bacterium]|nr:hypothetical protein [Solirubrobacteraceae bacterium]